MALYEIAVDVNFSTGNIDFIGTVVGKGDVKTDLKFMRARTLLSAV